MPDWSWFDDLKAKWAGEDLEAETDRSLERDPGRWSWRNSNQIDTEERHHGGRGRHAEDRRHRSGKGDVHGGESGERTSWRDQEWRTARDDYRRQNPDDRNRDDRDEDRGLFW